MGALARRSFFQAPGDTAFHYAWLQERGGFELPVSRGGFPTENPREHRRNFALKSISIVQRIVSPPVLDEFSRRPSNSGVTRMRLG